jgi:hypothetical protein
MAQGHHRIYTASYAKRGRQNPEPTHPKSNQSGHRAVPQRGLDPVAQPSCLGAQYHRLRTRLGAPKAITALARKLACLFYRLIKHGPPYVEKGTEHYEGRYREQQIRSLTKPARRSTRFRVPRRWPQEQHGCPSRACVALRCRTLLGRCLGRQQERDGGKRAKRQKIQILSRRQVQAHLLHAARKHLPFRDDRYDNLGVSQEFEMKGNSSANCVCELMFHTTGRSIRSWGTGTSL